jgi:hypothetical protein
MSNGTRGYTVVWKSARRAEKMGRPDIAMQRYLLAASMAETRFDEEIALVCAWICRERMFGRLSELEVGDGEAERPRTKDGHLGAIEE